MNNAIFAPSSQSGALTTPLQADDYIRASRSDNTLRAYRSDWQQFVGWCNRRRLSPLPAAEATVCRYLAEQAEQDKVATLARRVASISQAHQAAGLPSPTLSLSVRATLKGIRRKKNQPDDRKGASAGCRSAQDGGCAGRLAHGQTGSGAAARWLCRSVPAQ